MINGNTIHILVLYTIIYSSLIIPKYTLSYSINHALIKSCISQCSFHFNWQACFSIPIFHNLKSIQLCSQIQFNSTIQFSYAHQFNYALNEFNVCLLYRISESPAPSRWAAGRYQNGFITQYGPAGLLTGYKKSISEHYRYGPAGLLIGVTHQYNRSQYCYLTPIGIPIYP